MAFFGEKWATLRPLMETSPAVGVRIPYRMFIRVDLPAPFSPTRAKISPGRMERLTSSLAFTPGNSMDTWENAMIGSIVHHLFLLQRIIEGLFHCRGRIHPARNLPVIAPYRYKLSTYRYGLQGGGMPPPPTNQ